MSDTKNNGFKKGFDPNRNTLAGPGRTPEYDIKKVTGPVRQQMLKKICEIMQAPIGDVQAIVENLNTSLADSFAAKALLKTARDEPTLDNMIKLLKILGHKFEEAAPVNINLSLEDLVTASHADDDERIVEAANGSKVIVRKKKDE